MLTALGGVALAGPRSALADRVLILDIVAEPKLAVEAAAVSLLVPSLLQLTEPWQMVPRSELAAAIAAIIGSAGGPVLALDRSFAAQLARKVNADRMVLARLVRSGDHLRIVAELLGPEGGHFKTVDALAPPGEIGYLAQRVAARLATQFGGTAAPAPGVSLQNVRAFLSAAALLKGDADKAAALFAVAPPGSAAQPTTLRLAAQSVWQDTDAPMPVRIGAALAANATEVVLRLTEEALAANPDDVDAHAARVRAYALKLDYENANRALATLPKTRAPLAVTLARVDLAVRRNDPVAARDDALAPVLDLPGDKVGPLLAYISTTPAKTFGPAVEMKLLSAAERAAVSDPLLASAAAVRAIQGGIEVKRAVPLVQAQEIPLAELQPLVEAVAAGGSSAAVGLRQHITQREHQMQALELADVAASYDPSLEGLVQALRPLLTKLQGLQQSGGVARVVVIPLMGSGQLPLWPVTADAARLGVGLKAAVATPPFDLAVAAVAAGIELADSTPDEQVAASALEAGSDAALLYRVRAGIMAAHLELRLVEVAGNRRSNLETSVEGKKTGLLRWNMETVIGMGVVALLLMVIAVLMLSSASVVVRIRHQQAGDVSDMLCVAITRSPDPPTIEDGAAFVDKMRKQGEVHRPRLATMVKREAQFRLSRPGTWYVHLYGVQVKDKQISIVAGEAFTRPIVVRLRHSNTVAFSLEAVNAEFHVIVSDATHPVSNARVWLNDNEAKAVRTPMDGKLVLPVPRGQHVLHIDAKGIHIERPYEVIGPTIRMFEIKLEWERRVDDVSRVLEQMGVAPATPVRSTGVYATKSAPEPQVSRFTRLGELGRHKALVIYQAEDSLGAPVALAVLPRPACDDPQQVERFVREAQILTSLEHPNIVSLLDQGVDNGELYMAIELVQGATLEAALAGRGGKLPLRAALAVIDQLCAAVAHAHAKGIVHREIRPSSILVSGQNVVKLAFGTARVVQALHLKLGAPRPLTFAPPEQIRRQPLDGKADIYCIGCTLFQLLIGTAPFDDGDVMQHHLETPPIPPSWLLETIPIPIDELVVACMAKEKEARPLVDHIRQVLLSTTTSPRRADS